MMLKLLWLLRLLMLETDAGELEEQEEDDDTEDVGVVRDPEAYIKALKDQVERLHKKVRKQDSELRDLRDQSNDAALRDARLEAAFLRAAVKRGEPIADLETAWDLGHVRGFFDAVTDDGEGMGEALDKICQRYPYLLDVDGAPTEPESSIHKGQRRVKPTREAHATDRAMRERFPALRGRR